MKKVYYFLVLILSVLALVSSANASTLSFTTSIFEDGGSGDWHFGFISGNNNQKWDQPTFVGYGDPADNPPYSINLSQFNPSLGSLSRVTLSLSRTVDAAVFCQASSSPTTFRYYLANQAAWVMSGITLGEFTYTLTNYPAVTAISDQNYHTMPQNQTDNSPIHQFTSDFAPFIGTGTFATELFEAAAFGGIFGNGRFGSSFQVTAEATVTYDYTHVPLPPTVLLLGSGLLGLGLLRGRKLFKS